MHLQQTANPLGPPTAGIQYGVAGLQLSGIDADKSQLANERIGHDLESQSGERLVIVGFARDLLSGVRIRASNFAGVNR